MQTIPVEIMTETVEEVRSTIAGHVGVCLLECMRVYMIGMRRENHETRSLGEYKTGTDIYPRRLISRNRNNDLMQVKQVQRDRDRERDREGVVYLELLSVRLSITKSWRDLV